MKRSLYLIIIAIFFVLQANAYNLVVTMVNEDTGVKIEDVIPTAHYQDMRLISEPEINEADTTYIFSNLPEEPLLICYTIDGKLIKYEVPTPVESVKIIIPDTLLQKSIMLNEVVVEGDNSYMNENKSVYRPTSGERKMATDGTSLLRVMSISGINISPIDGEITTLSGESISVFIDYMPASQTDIANIRTVDVKRVEMLDYPQDPRFGGAKYVINFIMKKYEYGGYTKLTAQERIMSEYGRYDMYSKFTYKKMTYELGAGYNWLRTERKGHDTFSLYDFGEKSVEYNNSTISDFYSQRGASGFLKGIYQTQKSLISNMVSITSSKKPHDKSCEMEKFNSSDYISGEANIFNNSSNYSVLWKGDYQISLSDDLMLSIEPQASYGRYKKNYLYSAHDDVVDNRADDKAWNVEFMASIRKMFGKHSLTASLVGAVQGHDIDYTGTTTWEGISRYWYSGLILESQMSFANFSIYPTIQLAVIKDKSNVIVQKEVLPQFYIPMVWNINPKNRLTFVMQLMQSTYPASLKSADIQIQNQIDALTGNPKLKTEYLSNIQLNYNWMPIRNMSVSAYVGFNRSWRVINSIYEPEVINSREMMMRTYINKGFSNVWKYGASVGGKLFNNNLSLRGGLNVISTFQHTVMPYSGSFVFYNFDATYSLKRFYFQAIYYSKSKIINPYYYGVTPNYYSFTVGWSNGDLNVSASALNPFRTSYKFYKMITSTPNYYSLQYGYSSQYRQCFDITVSYSLSYGKKLQRGYESKAIKGVGSGILE